MGGKGTQNAGTCTGVVIVVENLETLTVALQYASVPKFCHATDSSDSRLIQDISTSCLPLVCHLFATVALQKLLGKGKNMGNAVKCQHPCPMSKHVQQNHSPGHLWLTGDGLRDCKLITTTLQDAYGRQYNLIN
jgi:hypothetical protein